MSFSLDLTDEQTSLRDQTHRFARDVIRPVAAEYDRAQEFPWPVLEEAARAGLYGWELYAQLSTDPTGLRRHRSLNRDARARPGRYPPGRDRRAARPLGP
jgi:alkylation response protein AidB-like acyl-CoA dehydrogenase